jgi:hypothetical protein
MNFQTAAIVAGSTGILSFVFGLIGGVPLFDIVLRALFWAAAGFGGSLAVETLLRNLVPDVFDRAPQQPSEDSPAERAVDIVLDEETPARSGFVEEDEDEPVRRAPPPVAEVPVAASSAEAEANESEDGAAPAAAASEAEEMPEIGAFLDAFKPGATDEEEPAAASPDYGDYTPAPSAPEPYAPQEAFMDGEPQDPVALAKAVQTVLKRDS